MKYNLFILTLLLQLSFGATAQAVKYSTKGQAMPAKIVNIEKHAFEKPLHTEICWLGNAGFFINSRGTTLMVDPLLKGFDMPLLFEPPIQTEQVPHLDAILVTHADNDHYSIPTCVDLAAVCNAFHSTGYVDSLMKNQRLNSVGHQIGDRFSVKQIEITFTPSDH